MNTNEIITAIADTKEESIKEALSCLCNHDDKNKSIYRPDISLPKIIAGFFLWIVISCLAVFAVEAAGTYLKFSDIVICVVSVVAVVLIICIKAKSIVRNGILIYQKYAPEKLRKSCLFTPSCSEYMLLAIDKYGVVVGIIKGIKRLSRCHFPNGGVDLP